MNAGPDFAERVEPNQRKFRSELVFGGSLTLNAARDGRPAVLVPYRGAWCPRWIVAASRWSTSVRDGPTAVVDGDLKIYGIQRLRIADHRSWPAS